MNSIDEGGAKARNTPTLIEFKDLRFLIMDTPSDSSVPAFVQELQKYSADVVVRACDPTYGIELLKKAKIQVVELPFVDGDPPPESVIHSWLSLVRDHTATSKENVIAVHCIAGLGRAPVLVALALIEAGLEPYDAIDMIRKKRRGALNHRQMLFLDKYSPNSSVLPSSACCTIV